MRIAFASYEFPEETGGGGIGTYLRMVTNLLQAQGHSIVVFCGTKNKEAFWESDFVYRLPADGWQDFGEVLPTYFLPVHRDWPFDVLEATDFEGCGLSVKKLLPELATVVRLHTPLYLVNQLLYQPLSWWKKLRFIFGSLRSLRLPRLPTGPKVQSYAHEFELIERAEIVSSPSFSITQELKNLGFAVANKTQLIPLPFDIRPFSYIDAKPTIDQKAHIFFIGRLEIRKGVLDLAQAIPKVLREQPNAHFTFVGSPSASPTVGLNMAEYLKLVLKKFSRSVTFIGQVESKKINEYLDRGDVFVFPSHYESFGLACCEAMSAGKAVIGSRSGGMAEIIENNKSGLLVLPHQPTELAHKILEVINDNALRLSLGKEARKRITNYLSPARVVEQQLSCYEAARRIIVNHTISL